MADWVVTNFTVTGSPTADTNAQYGLTINESAPSQFDPSAVSAVSLTSLLATGSGFGDDQWHAGSAATGDQTVALATALTGGTVLASNVATVANDQANADSSNTQKQAVSTAGSGGTINSAQNTAAWEGAVLRFSSGTNVIWFEYDKTKGGDGTAITFNSASLTITYTPQTNDYVETGLAVSITATVDGSDAGSADLVVKSQSSTVTAAIPLQISYPSGTAVGDIILALFWSSIYTQTITTPSGWTKVAETTETSAQGMMCEVLMKEYESGDGASETFSLGEVSNTSGRMFRIGRASGTTLGWRGSVDVVSNVTNYTTATSTFDPPSVTTKGRHMNQNGTREVAIACWDPVASVTAYPSGFDDTQFTENNVAIGFKYTPGTLATSNPGTFTLGTSQEGVAWTIAFREGPEYEIGTGAEYVTVPFDSATPYGDTVTTPSSTDYNFSDGDLRMRVKKSSFTSATDAPDQWMERYGGDLFAGDAADEQWVISYDPFDGRTRFPHRDSGGTEVFPNNGPFTKPSANDVFDVRFVYDADNGSSQYAISYYIRTNSSLGLDEDEGWTFLETDVFTTAQSMQSVTSAVTILNVNGTVNNGDLLVLAACAFAGLDNTGTLLWDPDFTTTRQTSDSGATFVDDASRTWTVNGNAAWSGDTAIDETGLAVAITATVTASDTADFTESVTVAVTSSVTLTDTQAMTDSLTVDITSTVTGSDLIVYVETALPVSIAATVSVADTAAFTDSDTVDVIATVGRTDILATSESVTVAITSTVTGTDARHMTEAVAVAIVATVAMNTEILAFNEAVTVAITSTVSATDVFTPAEFDETGLPVAIVATVTSSDTQAMVEAQTVAIVATAVVSSEISAVNEAVTVAVVATVDVTDVFTPAQFEELNLPVPITATVTSTDTLDASESLSVSIAATVTASDNFNGTNFVETGLAVPITATVTLSTETVAVNESLAVAVVATATQSDVLAASDPALPVAITATVGVTDSHAGVESPTIDITSTVAVSDTHNIGGTNYGETGRAVAITATVTATDAYASNESVTVPVVSSVSATDTAAFTESVQVDVLASVTESDTATFTDSLTVTVISNVLSSDNLTNDSTEEVQVDVLATVVATDALATSEDVAVAVVATVTVTEVSAVGESLTVSITATVTATDVTTDFCQVLVKTGFTATAIDSSGGSTPADALDGNYSTTDPWVSNTGMHEGAVWWQVDLQQDELVCKVELYQLDTNRWASSVKLESSPNGTDSWTDHGTFSGLTNSGAQVLELSSPHTDRYWRLTEQVGTIALWSIHEVDVFEWTGPTDYDETNLPVAIVATVTANDALGYGETGLVIAITSSVTATDLWTRTDLGLPITITATITATDTFAGVEYAFVEITATIGGSDGAFVNELLVVPITTTVTLEERYWIYRVQGDGLNDSLDSTALRGTTAGTRGSTSSSGSLGRSRSVQSTGSTT